MIVRNAWLGCRVARAILLVALFVGLGPFHADASTATTTGSIALACAYDPGAAQCAIAGHGGNSSGRSAARHGSSKNGPLKPAAWSWRSDGSLIATNSADDVLRLGTKDSWGNLTTLDDHFARHGADFGAASADDYARQASEFLQQPGTLTKIDPKTGVIRVYDPATEAFGAYNPTGTTRTFYIPDPAKHGYPTNLDYWNAQPG